MENEEKDEFIKSKPSVIKIKYEGNFYSVIPYYGEFYDVLTEKVVCKIGEEEII